MTAKNIPCPAARPRHLQYGSAPPPPPPPRAYSEGCLMKNGLPYSEGSVIQNRKGFVNLIQKYYEWHHNTVYKATDVYFWIYEPNFTFGLMNPFSF